jgi:excisionase family DNA binding protein
MTATDWRTHMPARTDPEHTWLTVLQLAELLTITERHIRRLVAERRIPVTRIGGRLRFNEARIMEWLDEHSQAPRADGHGGVA